MYCFTCVGFKNHQEGIHVPYAKVLLTLKVAGGINQSRERHFHIAVHKLISCSSFIVARLCMLLFLMHGYICFCCAKLSFSFIRWGHPNFPALFVLFCTIGPKCSVWSGPSDGRTAPLESMLINQIAFGCLVYLLQYLLLCLAWWCCSVHPCNILFWWCI
jgi:hypothetical protein